METATVENLFKKEKEGKKVPQLEGDNGSGKNLGGGNVACVFIDGKVPVEKEGHKYTIMLERRDRSVVISLNRGERMDLVHL